LRIKIRFQTYVKVEVGTILVNRPEITASITKQIVNVNCPEPVLIEITSLTNWPYKLQTDFSLSLTPPGKVVSADLEYSDCADVEGSPCRQKWRTILDLTNTTCTLDGNYQLSFNRVCSRFLSECPLRSEDDKKVVLDYALTSENFCAIVSVEIGLSATIQLFEDLALMIPRSTYMVGQRGYFKIRVSSDLNTNIETIIFSKINILTITVRAESSRIPLLILENGVPTAENVQIELYESSNRDVKFSFVFTQGLTRLLKPNGKKSYTIGVELDVHFLNNAKKRASFEMLSEESEQATFSQDVNIEGATFEPTTASEITGKSKGRTDPQMDNGFALVASILLMMVALLF
jgi:hypothetical protein